jgi:hypothetical protein
MHKISTVAFALALSVAGSNVAKADQPGTDWMPLQQVVDQVLRSVRLPRLKPKTVTGKAKASRTVRRWILKPTQRPA